MPRSQTVRAIQVLIPNFNLKVYNFGVLMTPFRLTLPGSLHARSRPILEIA